MLGPVDHHLGGERCCFPTRTTKYWSSPHKKQSDRCINSAASPRDNSALPHREPNLIAQIKDPGEQRACPCVPVRGAFGGEWFVYYLASAW